MTSQIHHFEIYKGLNFRKHVIFWKVFFYLIGWKTIDISFHSIRSLFQGFFLPSYFKILHTISDFACQLQCYCREIPWKLTNHTVKNSVRHVIVSLKTRLSGTSSGKRSLQVFFSNTGPSESKVKINFICCSSGQGQKSQNSMYQNKTSYTACYICNLAKQHRFFLINGLSMYKK